MKYLRLFIAAVAAITIAWPAIAGIQVTGQVLAPDGASLRGATVILFPSLGDYQSSLEYLAGRRHPTPVVTTRTNQQGFFSVEAPDPGLWRIEVSSAGYVTQRHNFTPLLEAVHLPPVTLPADGGMTVQVTDIHGKPLSGAQVFALRDRPQPLRPQPGWRSALSLGVTGEDGQIEISGSRDERIRLRALAAGHLESALVEIQAGEDPPGSVSLKLEPGLPRTIEVRDDSGRPQAEVLVNLGDWGMPAGLTGEEGRFEITVPRRGDVLVEIVSADGRGHQERLAHQPQEASPKVLQLPGLVEIHGRVVDAATRNNLAGALVWLRNYRGLLTRTNHTGSFTLRFVPRGSRVSVESVLPGYFRETVVVARSELSRRPTLSHGKTLALKPATAIEGTVVDTDAEPVAGVLVRLRESQPSMGSMTRQQPGREALAASNEEGRFRLRWVRPHTAYDLEIDSPGFAPHRRAIVAPEAGDAKPLEPIVLSRGELGFGFVLDAGDQPIVGAEAILERPPAPPLATPGASYSGPVEDPVVVARAPSDAEGRFELHHLAPGRFQLRLTAPGFASVTIPGVEVADGAAEVDLGSWRLEPGVAINGQVQDSGGQAVSGAEIHLRPRGKSRQGRPVLFDLKAAPATHSAIDGTFTLADLAQDATFDLYVDGAQWTGILIPDVTAPRDGLTVTVQPSAILAGRVTDESGRPIPQVWVFATLPTMAERHAFGPAPRQRSDAEGRFELTDVTPGALRIAASAEGRRDYEQRLDLAPGQKLLDYEIVMTEGATLVGQVRDAEGRPVVGARVGSTSSSDNSYTPVYTDGGGRYRIPGLGPGPRDVRVSTFAGQHTRGKVVIEPGENVLDLSFEKPGMTLSGQVVGPEGEQLPGIRLQLFEHEEFLSAGVSQGYSWRPRSLTTSRADGAFVFEQVSEGRYRIQALGPGFVNSNSDQELEVRAAPVSGVVIHLSPGTVLRGQIHGVPAEELSRLLLTATAPSGSGSLQGEVSADGTYRFTDLGPGTWHVSVLLPTRQRRIQETVTLSPGESEAILDLDFSSGFALTGQLVAGGEPRGWVRIRLRQLTHSDWQVGVPQFLHHAKVLTQGDGQFRFEGLEPGRYQLHVEISGMLQLLDEIELDDEQNLVLELPLGRLTGRVVDATGQGLVAARLQVERLVGQGHGNAAASSLFLPQIGQFPMGQAQAGQPQSDTDGGFVLDGLEPGRYRITAHKEGYGPGWREAELLAGGAVQGLELVLQSTPGLELEVVDPTGRPSPHIIAAFVDSSGQGVFGGMHVPDSGGRVKIRNAPLGQWRLLVKGSGAATTVGIEVPAPGPVRVVLPPSGALRITVPEQVRLDAGATLTLRDAEGRSYREPDHLGRIVESWPIFGRPAIGQALPVGVWTVRITAGGQTWEKTVQAAAGAVTDVAWE